MAPADSIAAAPTGAPTPLETLVEQYESRLNGVAREPGDLPIYQGLVARDQIAAKSGDGGPPPLALARRICALDAKLKDRLRELSTHECVILEELRTTLQPPEENWWWVEPKTLNPWWTIGAVLFLTFSVTLITDFTRRILSADPDAVGITSVAVQALLAVAATSTFTDGGKEWMERALARMGVRPQMQPRWKLASTVVLFALVFWAWLTMPGHLAWLYNNRGIAADQNGSSGGLHDYELAVALSPDFAAAHFNLGEAYEQNYLYDKATAEYQQALVLNPYDISAYANLSRLLTISNNAFTGLRVADKGVAVATDVAKRNPKRATPQTIASLKKDRAWAEFQLGFYEDAETDAKASVEVTNVAASGYCVLGKIYSQTGRTVEAQRAWKSFNAALQAPGATPPVLEPDCTRLAEAGSK